MANESGKGWYRAKTRRVDLSDYGRADLYVDFVDPTSLPYGKTKALQAKYGATAVPGEDETPSEETVSRMLEMIIELIDTWNIEHPVTGEPMPIPTKASYFEELPLDVITKMFTGALGTISEEAVPLASETPSEQPSVV